jgi:hypothetical protein
MGKLFFVFFFFESGTLQYGIILHKCVKLVLHRDKCYDSSCYSSHALMILHGYYFLKSQKKTYLTSPSFFFLKKMILT